MPALAQFLVEQQCKERWPPGPEPEWPSCLPICLWVELEGCRLHCGGRSFRVVTRLEAVNGNGERFVVSALTDPASGRITSPHVCEHMGHLIE